MAFFLEEFLPMLLGWSCLWFAGSTLGLWMTSGRGFWRSFWFMNALWCTVNVGIGIWALLDPPSEVADFRRILLVNSGLDVAYLVVGVILLTRTLAMLKGFGAAIILQGAALFVFDLAWWATLGG